MVPAFRPMDYVRLSHFWPICHPFSGDGRGAGLRFVRESATNALNRWSKCKVSNCRNLPSWTMTDDLRVGLISGGDTMECGGVRPQRGLAAALLAASVIVASPAAARHHAGHASHSAHHDR